MEHAARHAAALIRTLRSAQGDTGQSSLSYDRCVAVELMKIKSSGINFAEMQRRRAGATHRVAPTEM